MLTRVAHARPTGGLSSENSNFTMLLLAFLKGHIEAIVAMVDHSHYLKLFMSFVDLILKLNCRVFVMMLIASEGGLTKVRKRNCQFQ